MIDPIESQFDAVETKFGKAPPLGPLTKEEREENLKLEDKIANAMGKAIVIAVALVSATLLTFVMSIW